MSKIKKSILFLALLICAIKANCQQDPQFTLYNYNTMTVNPGYAGTRGHLAILSLYRDQWVGIDGAPRTISVGVDKPVGLFDGLGLSIIQDDIGPSQETYIDGNYSHQLILNRRGDRLSLGIKAGVRMFSLDWSKGLYRDPDTVFNQNVNSKLLPTIGAGVYYYTDRSYFGLSVPNIITDIRYDEIQEQEASEKIHYYLIAGYVLDLNRDLKFKPSIFVKHINGAPLSVDTSANFLLYEKFNFGVNYRWSESVSALMGFQITPQFSIGYAYDFTINNLTQYNSGTHEIFLRYQFLTLENILKSPRFF
ncbi:type IX secretion system membrane protein PorP/SprF [Cellulophaga baltica]|uniref:PorP/SprF family type IX secretion system membrane protein n=1 Tax=Cellulophaga TaxID=104264 RepID=UPI001C071709|nr:MULTISPECIES: type IX secretion system membrane protein PorP/SprF [Cellulophaga]MBU2997580.1 type IX secretion system membrane protein PorP/SprF [Cellulophaga baltica]MDO6768975.1 type IX secretion system membrane protein PorP/SprF [Cellulophaga sp. 1_MG-2023]